MLRHQIDWAAEQLGKRVLKVGDLPTEPGVRGQLVEQIDVAAVIRLAANEDLGPGDAVSSAQFVEAIEVNIEQLGHVYIVPRSGHEGDTRSPESL